MKYFFILLAFLLSSCQQTLPTDTGNISDQLTYFKDARTGLCFAAINSVNYGGYSTTSITCVPCDSLRRFEGF